MKFLSDILARAGLTVDGVVTFNNTATGQTPATNDNSTKLATTAFIKNQSYLTANQTITVSGDATGSGTTSIALTLANSGVTAGTYGNASNIPTIVVDSKGRITSISTNAVSIITTLAGLSDVTLTSPSANQVLQYNGTRWVNGAAPTTYTLPIATASVLGGIKVGDGLSIDAVTGVLSASAGGGGLNFRTIQEFTATAGQTTFTITGGYTPGYIEVLINGVYVSESEYTASNGTTVVLDNAVAHNDIVTVFLYSLYNLGSSNYARNISTLTATAGQTVFNVSYIPGQIDIFYNGSKLTSSEFTATNGTTVTLVQAAVLGDILEVVTYLAGAGVNASRTLTINGVTYDLSADRSWTIPTGTSGSGTTNYLSKWTGSTSLGNSLIFDNGSGIGINTASPFESSAFKLDVNGGVIIKNTSGTAAQLILIDSNPATGGNNGFVQLSAGGNTATAFGQWQTYYGTSIASGTLRLQPAGGVVLVGSSTAVTGAGLLQVAGDVNITGTFRINGTAIALGTTLNGTGFVKASGTTITYDNSTYLTTSSASSTYLPLIGGTLTGALGGTSATFSSLVTISSDSGGSALRLIGRSAADASAIRFFTNNNVTQNARIESNSSALEINSISALPITFYTSDALRLTIASTGGATFNSTVGVGGTSAINTFTVRAATNNNLDVFDNITGVGIQAVNNTNTVYRTLTFLGSSLSFTGSATFNNNVTVSGQIISNNAAGVNAVIWARGGADGVGQGKGNFRTSDAGGTNFFDFGRDNLSTGNFVLTSGGGSPLLSITTTGLTTFSGNVNVTVPNTPEVLLTHSNTSRTFLMAVDGTNAFFRANSTANILFQVAGGTNALTLSSTGVATFSVPRTNGTNATSIILSDTLTGVSTPGFGLRIFGYSNGGGVQSAIGFENGGTGTNNESQLSFYTQNIAGGLSQRLLISSTGAAIFSSSVTANGGVYIPNGNYYYAQRNTGSANIGVLGFASGSDTLTIKGGTSGASNSINFEDTGGIIASFFNGRLGIGTTSSPGTKLEVLSVAASADRTLPHNILTLTAEQGNAPYGPFGGAILFKNRSYVSGLVESSRIRSVIYDDGAPNNFGGGLWFETTPTPGGALTPSLIVNYQGRVGINTLNPDYRLQVNSPNAVLKLLSTGASFGSPSINMLQGSIDTVISATNNGLEIGTWSSHPIIFRVGSTGISEAMRITAGGVPGIKTVPTSGWGSAMAAVQVGTGGVLANWTGSNNNFSAGVNFYDNGAGSQLRLYNGGVSKIDFSENEIIFSNAVSNSANTSISFTTRMRLQGNGALSIGRTFGNSYSQTSTSGGTSIVDTGITYDTGDYGGYGRGATYQVVYVGNPNNAGSGAYFAQFVGILMVYTGWSGSAVTTYIQYNQIASGTNIGTLTLTPVFWNGSSETSSIGVYTGGAQIRLKISGYNSSWPGADQSVYLTRLT